MDLLNFNVDVARKLIINDSVLGIILKNILFGYFFREFSWF